MEDSAAASKKSAIPSNWAKKWTPAEDERLLKAIEEFGFKWKKVAEVVATRDATNCLQRWDRVLRPDRVKGQWLPEEDEKLVHLIAQGIPNWGQISKVMEGRSSKQCRERWINYLDPSLKHTPWTGEEDALLIQLQASWGNRWSLISREIPGRSENAVRGRFVVLSHKVEKAMIPHKRKRDEANLDLEDGGGAKTND
jgi:hypothetical protein